MKLLLHTCCAPCSVYCIDSLRKEGIEPTVYWFNPNIHPYMEYKARRDCLKEYTKSINVESIFEENYGLREFCKNVVNNLENRCKEYCYPVRLEQTAKYAKENGFDAISTTLLVSPYQNHEALIEVAKFMAKKYGVKLLIDSARFAENAYFIKTREAGYADKSIIDICREIYSHADYMTMSAKKDGIVNIGGFLGFKDEKDMQKCQMYSIMFEGYLTYGGMAGRDMNALAQGLRESMEFDYLETRIKQVAYLASKLDEYGIPYQRPAGGHAIFVDAKKILTNVPKEEFQAQTLAIELYLEAGIRGVEIGALLADRDPDTKENRYPRLELLRLAIPRRVYTNNHMDYIAAALKNVYDRRESITSGYRITKELPIMRHFTIELEKVKR